VLINFDEPITLLIFTKGGEWFASVEDLRSLTGIGSTEADAMKELRQRVKVFQPALELMDDWEPPPLKERWRSKLLVFSSRLGHSAKARFEKTTLNDLLAP